MNRRHCSFDRRDEQNFSTVDNLSNGMTDELLYRFATARLTRQEQDKVAEWVDNTAENAERFGEVITVLNRTAQADDELKFGTPPTMDDLMELSRGSVRVTRPVSSWRTLMVAAALIATVAIGVPVMTWLSSSEAPVPVATFGSDEFVTESESATVGLRDGTVVRLARDSRLRVHERVNAREVSLVGRGYFAVAHDEHAPFTIHSNAGTVTVLGTRFDLTVDGEDLRIIVLEGAVRLTVRGMSAEVHAGQMAQILKGNLVPSINVPDPESLAEWVGNFIVFQNTPLSTAAREIESRHGVQIQFSDSALGDRTVTAFFAGRSFEDISEVLCVVLHLHCTTLSPGVLRMAPAR